MHLILEFILFIGLVWTCDALNVSYPRVAQIFESWGGESADIKVNYGAQNVRKRFIDLMRRATPSEKRWKTVHHEECVRRIAKTQRMRFMYEESPHYEMGYIMGELIERYRKMIVTINHSNKYFSVDHTSSHMYRTATVQKLYLEIDHLRRMMHEIPRKWQDQVEFKNIYATAMDSDMVEQIKKTGFSMDLEDRKRERQWKKHYQNLVKRGQLLQQYQPKINQLSKGIINPPKDTNHMFGFLMNYGWPVQYNDWVDRHPLPKYEGRD